ncbi:MAG: PQQ-binding-like beta-propeller repeat protein, partial [Verrucomicrobiae bacterium]|nr:PQQ-binding-like beta-propeller repeat protein [Verrucomicrobiae bacterium]
MKFPALLLLSLCVSSFGLQADVFSWRNGGNGLYPEATTPIDWNHEELVLWKSSTPDWANACPILVGDKLFYTVEPADLVCADARTGEVLWTRSNAYEDVYDMPESERQILKKKLGGDQNQDAEIKALQKKVYNLTRRQRNDTSNERLNAQLEAAQKELADLEEKAGAIPEKFIKPRTHNTNGHASMTPCSDGKYVYTGNNLGIIVKYDLDGNRIWARIMERPDHNWGASVSPQLIEGKLIVRFSDYAALDPETGEELWRVKDPQTFGTPATFQVEGQAFLYTVRGELIRVSDGKKLPSQDWTIDELPFAFFNTPFVKGNRVYVVHGAAGLQGDVYCMEIPQKLEELNRKGLKQIWHTEASKE